METGRANLVESSNGQPLLAGETEPGHRPQPHPAPGPSPTTNPVPGPTPDPNQVPVPNPAPQPNPTEGPQFRGLIVQ
jgi:hypothetical protein